MAPTLGLLPSELIFLIAELLDVPSLNSLLQSCQRLACLLDSSLYTLARRYRSVPGAGTPLIWAAQNGVNTVVARLLGGESWPSDSQKGTTALHEAIKASNEEGIRLLLDAGANVFAEDRNGDAALLTAISCDRDVAARLILSVYPAVQPWESYSWHWTEAALRAAQLDISESMRRLVLDCIRREYPEHAPDLLDSVLHTAAAPTGDCAVMQMLCDYGANPLAIIPGGTTTLLHTFAIYGHLDATEWGLARGIDPIVEDGTGVTAFSIAVARGHPRLVQIFLDLGMDPNVPSIGISPLCIAAAEGHMAVVQCLLAAGADILARDDRGFNVVDFVTGTGRGSTPLMPTPLMLEFLLRRGADPSPPPGTVRMTALHTAARLGLAEMTALLCAAAPVDAVDQRGRTALHLAVREGRVAAVTTLLEAGANPSIPDERRKTPIHEAAVESNSDILDLLLRYGADVHAADLDGHTPLYLAARTGQTAVVARLLEAGADPNAGWEWSSPLHFAVTRQATDMVRLLLSYRADPHALDLYGRSAFEWAGADSKILAEHPFHPTDPTKREARLRQTVAIFGERLLQTNKGSDHSEDCESCIVAKALLYLGRRDEARVVYAHDGGTGLECPEHRRPTCTACRSRIHNGSVFICLACVTAKLCQICKDHAVAGLGPGQACQRHEVYEIPPEVEELPGESEIGRDAAWRAWMGELVSTVNDLD
ncbi:uncharacterized protein DSM5745_10620 [Aspergillus mulundensis]|uniref:protein S-acyltransferase n=1 Tax=Aspergillus mulundensis TaxID=1810919 RepID=A0A3D8QH23_9EURO|nr:Uncharacterized protein DSM5745_10620 [Aspergillus mulundensis]RDW61122.1 Uncharacterized protein DSM5745_10620 [Aspergillus mulundensis]